MNAQIVLENIGVMLPQRSLFESVNWTLYEGMRVTLAGRNGSGKSTLLRILAGAGESTSGTRNVVGGKNLKIGFLDQALLDKAVIEEASESARTQSIIEFIEKTLPHKTHEDDHEDLGWKIRKILHGLGFNQEAIEGPLGSLSGGWLLRVFIARALVQEPDVLLLDEPTNHLDISSIQWLEEFLQRDFKGSVVLVTHDIELQRRVTNSLAVIHGGKFYFRTHQNDYVSFLASLADETVNLEKNCESLQKKIEENMEFVYRFRAKANTAARAQSKLKVAEELQSEMSILKDRIGRLRGSHYKMHFQFRSGDQGAKFPIVMQNISFRYTPEGEWISKGLNLEIKRGQRVAIIGDNGVGKTTLLNLVSGRLPPTDGNIMIGYGVLQGYFGQHQLDELNLEQSVFDNVRLKAQGISSEEMRGWMGAFGFSSEHEIDKKAKILSGGERARLALLRILVTSINVCLLDEPTNHLDIETKELLKRAVVEFPGTSMIVSHDREFLNAVAERIIYISSDHKVTDHLGNLESFFYKYPQFVRHLERQRRPSEMNASSSQKALEKSESTGPALSFEERKRIKNQLRSNERKIEGLEKDIETFGQRKTELQGKMENSQFESLSELEKKIIFDEARKVDSKLNEVMSAWEKLSSEVETIKQKHPDIR